MKKIVIAILLSSALAFAQAKPTKSATTAPRAVASASANGTYSIAWSWVDSTDSAATYNIYFTQQTGASVCPSAPVTSPPAGFSIAAQGLAAGTTSFVQTGLAPSTLVCGVATAVDPKSGLESVPSDQATVLIPSPPTPPPPPTGFQGTASLATAGAAVKK